MYLYTLFDGQNVGFLRGKKGLKHTGNRVHGSNPGEEVTSKGVSTRS